MSLKTFVVDTSVCLKLILDDEIYSLQAIELLKKYRDGKLNLIAPNILIYELANAIRTASVKNNLGIKKSLKQLKRLLNIFPNTIGMEDVMDLCLKNALRFGISVYDAAYITLADAHGITFVTADDKLVDTVNDPKLAISLKDIKIKT